jgi:drug/metabolite transporter (DMT)-like permease
MEKRTRFLSISLVLFAASLWASSGIFVNGVLTHSDLSPINLAFLREILTFLFLIVIFRIRKQKILPVKKQDLIWLALMGGVGIGLFHAIWNYSVIINGMSVATMLQYNEAVIISIAAVIFFKERIHWRKVAAIIGSLSGTALISGIVGIDTTQVTKIGLIIGISSALAHAAFHLFGKKLSGSYPTSTIMVYAFGFATLILLPFQLSAPIPSYLPTKAILYLIILVSGPTLSAFAVYTLALKWLPISTAAVIATFEVPMAVLFGTVFLSETLDQWQIIGAAFVILGVMLVSIRGKSNQIQNSV